VDWAITGDDETLHAGAFEGDGAEVLLVLRDVVTKDIQQSLGLLGAEIDALEVIDMDLVRSLLVEGAEDQEEIPDGETYLHAISIGVAVVGRFFECNASVVGLGDGLTHAYAYPERLGGAGEGT
jgi:hypothetical protein